MIGLLPLLAVFLMAGAADRITFPHDYHIQEEGLDCEDCHGQVDASTSLSKKSLLPYKEVCADCHDVEDSCGICHSNANSPGTYPVSGNTSGLDFPHDRHLSRFQDCLQCHQQVAEDDGSKPREPWPSWKCALCHQENPPMDHRVTWKDDHGIMVPLTGEKRCATCHTEVFCQDCHQFQQFAPTTHPVNYLFTHGLEAQVRAFECSTCHSVDNDCRKCHQQQLVMPVNHSLVRWMVPAEGGLHKEEAQDNPENCQVCHSVNSCAPCHGGSQ